MDYIKFVDIKNKRIYDLGKRSEAKYYLPFMAYKFQGEPIIFFGDETHPWLDDTYTKKEYGGDYNEGSVEELLKGYEYQEKLDDIIMSNKEYDEIFNVIGGIIITNLNYFIRYKYEPQ